MFETQAAYLQYHAVRFPKSIHGTGLLRRLIPYLTVKSLRIFLKLYKQRKDYLAKKVEFLTIAVYVEPLRKELLEELDRRLRRMLEKRGDFKLGKSFTDDGSGKRARITPSKLDDLIITSEEPTDELRKRGQVSQHCKTVDEILADAKKSGNS